EHVEHAEERVRTDELAELPAGGSVALELVEDEPSLALNYYLGGPRRRVVSNTDLPRRANDLLPVVAHELYPGHHTEHSLKEQLLVCGRGQLEESILMVGTPQSTVNEAIATLAPEMIAEDEDRLAAGLLEPLGVPYDAEVARVVREQS